MAEDKKKRKSDRHFNLEKPIERFFEIEKDVDSIDVTPTQPEASKPQSAEPIAPIKGSENIQKQSDTPKVEEAKKPEDINKPTGSPKAEDVKKPEENSTPYNPEGDASDGKSSKWKWLILAAIVAVAVPSYLFFTGNDDTSSTEGQIVATAPEAGQTNAGDNAADPNASTGESKNSGIVANPDGSGNVDNTEGSGNPSGSDLGSSDNPSETGNARNNSSGSGNVGSSSSEVKESTPQSSDVQSSLKNKAASVSSTASSGRSIVKEGKAETASRRGTSESGNSKNSGSSVNPVIPGSIEQKAFDVIRGIYGNGQVRKDKLGPEYAEIQKLVNEMYRNGTIKR